MASPYKDNGHLLVAASLSSHSPMEKERRKITAYIDPYIYLVDVLQRIDTHLAFDVHLLTPRFWKQHFADNPLRSDLDRLRQ